MLEWYAFISGLGRHALIDTIDKKCYFVRPDSSFGDHHARCGHTQDVPTSSMYQTTHPQAYQGTNYHQES